ncbi:MAG: RNA 3'-terminal phosphate cyclase, partial [Candidatus Methylomirabilales bacterium]
MPRRGAVHVSEPAVRIDGARGEGGGQLLRTALALAAIRRIPVEIHAIRARRRTPGLQAQHLTAVSALAAICGGRVEGAHLGSERLAFWPEEPRAGEYRFEIGTAGAATLVLQAILPALALAAGASRVHLTGGTHVPWSPPADYLREVLVPVLGDMGLRLGLAAPRWGFYPTGGGEIVVETPGRASLRALTRLRGPAPLRLRGVSAVANLPASIARRQADRALRRLEAAGYTAEIAEREAPAQDPGSFLLLVAEGDGPLGGFSALGRRGRRAEEVADEAVDRFLEFARTDAGCDPHLADQLVVPMALAAGTSRLTTSRVTAHLLTVLDVVGQLLGCPAQLTGEEGGPGALTLEGIGASREDGAEARGRGGAEA